ncbi:hypothetical protein [Archangium sp.]|jgi:hypothetical protein|uniref:hypothetical protein n=1 Tax=Archangium sp. TaxID=1872627 RepID=UPI002ED95620
MQDTFTLLTRFAVDPFLQDTFARDPTSALVAAGVAPDAHAATLQELRAPGQFTGEWNKCAACFDPGTDPEPWPQPDPLPTQG